MRNKKWKEKKQSQEYEFHISRLESKKQLRLLNETMQTVVSKKGNVSSQNDKKSFIQTGRPSSLRQ